MQSDEEGSRLAIKKFPHNTSYLFTENSVVYRGPFMSNVKRERLIVELPNRSDSYLAPPSVSQRYRESDIEEPEPERNIIPTDFVVVSPKKPEAGATITNQSKCERFKASINTYMSCSAYEIVMGIITIYIMYADYIRILSADKDTDQIFYIFSLICIFIFLLEIIVLCVVRTNYIFRFFFWMDLISTLSTFLEIPWVIRDLLGLDVLSGQTSMVKAGRASRVSSRATKIIRILRLIRIVRISKIYKYASQTIAEKFSQVGEIADFTDEQDFDQVEKLFNELVSPDKPEKQRQSIGQNNTMMISQFSPGKIGPNEKSPREGGLTLINILEQSNSGIQGYSTNESLLFKPEMVFVEEGSEQLAVQVEQEEDTYTQETKVGRTLSDRLTKKAILLIFTVIVSFPLFEYSTYWTDVTSFDTGLNILEDNYGSVNFDICLQSFIDFHNDQNVGSITVMNKVVYNENNYNQFRDEELKIYFSDSENSSVILVKFSDIQLNAILDILQTTFVVGVMVAGAILFSKDATDLVVTPIENMLSKVRRIAKNPLEAAKIEEDEEIIEQQIVNLGNNEKLEQLLEQNTYETYILEKLIIKTGALLAVGFGEAGANIIAENMRKGEAVNPLIPGNKMVGIFGFCDIRNFTDMTEILQERVMLFVNDIAQIVHLNVHNMNGSANKNIGDAFLLVWKLPASIVRITAENELITRKQTAINNFADLALLSFVKILVHIKKSYSLTMLASDPEIQFRLPGYKVKMGMGLHLGWAIEIDASYLSPHVNMSARLETATKQYGSYVLLSGPLYHALSAQVQGYVRHIDKVTVKGSEKPLDLFTFDMNLGKLDPDYFQKKPLSAKHQKILRYFKRRKLQLQMEKILMSQQQLINQYINDPDLLAIRQPYNHNFFAVFEQGMACYVKGQWLEAKVYFEESEQLMPHDGPSLALTKYMESLQFEAPFNWPGYRQLLEK